MNIIKYIKNISYYLLTLMFLGGAISYAVDPVAAAANYVSLGFPEWAMVFNGSAKIIGAVALLIPMTPIWVKDYVLAGFLYILLLAGIAHFYAGHGIYIPVVIGIILWATYVAITKFSLDKK